MVHESDVDPKKSAIYMKFYYFMGFMTACFLFLLIALFVAYKIGFSSLSTKLRHTVKSEPRYKQVVYLPDEILNELIKHSAVVENAGNPTNHPKHNTPLTQPDKDLKFILRPNVEISAYMLKSIQPYNWDPPVLYIDRRQNANLSANLTTYIKEQSRLHYTYSTDEHGFRKTVPSAKADRKILIVGDSVAFGVGVDDGQTIASCLQKKVGHQLQVVNGGVGGYDGRQAFKAAKKQAAIDKYSCLIYIACQNDFMQSDSGNEWLQEANHVLEQISAISNKFNRNVIVLFHTQMEYCLYEIMLEEGWEKEKIESTNLLRRELPKTCKRLNFRYGDGTDIINSFQRENKSILSPFALYVDHAHLSPLGSQLVADKLFGVLEDLKLVKSVNHASNR